MGSDVSAGNWNSPRFNVSSLPINPSISAILSAILWRSGFANPCGRAGVKWASKWLGKTACLHILQTTTRNSGKWIS
jgi:hypothetical protein